MIHFYRPYWDIDHEKVDWEIYPTIDTIHWIAWKKIKMIRISRVLKQRIVIE